MSSSMVYESTDQWPSVRGRRRVPPPLSSYGFQKLAVEYFARAAWDQYRLPYTILRPFNCVGIGEGRALGDVEVLSGNVKLAMSHVVPDLVQKVLKGQDPAAHPRRRVARSGTILTAGTWPRASSQLWSTRRGLNQDFNLSTADFDDSPGAGRGHLAQD